MVERTRITYDHAAYAEDIRVLCSSIPMDLLKSKTLTLCRNAIDAMSRDLSLGEKYNLLERCFVIPGDEKKILSQSEIDRMMEELSNVVSFAQDEFFQEGKANPNVVSNYEKACVALEMAASIVQSILLLRTIPPEETYGVFPFLVAFAWGTTNYDFEALEKQHRQFFGVPLDSEIWEKYKRQEGIL